MKTTTDENRRFPDTKKNWPSLSQPPELAVPFPAQPLRRALGEEAVPEVGGGTPQESEGQTNRSPGIPCYHH